jgi:hypothetical protein
VFDLQHLLRSALDGMSDCLAMGGAKYKRLQYQHVQGALNHLGLQR